MLVKQDKHGAIERPDDLIPNTRSRKASVMTPEHRATVLKNMITDLKVLKTPGIKPIKQVELYQKWRPLLPVKAREITCPKPSDEIMKKVKSDRAAKKRSKNRVEESGNETAVV